MKKYKSFETERLLIQPTSEEDAQLILELMNTPKWIKNIGNRNVKSIEDAKDYILTKIKPQLVRLGYSNYTIIRKVDNLKIGTCGLYDRKGLDGIDIGFALLPKYEKKGYAFEAANTIKNAAFNDLGLKTIGAITSKENIASQNLLKKLGLELIGTTILPNSNEELLVYKLSKK